MAQSGTSTAALAAAAAVLAALGLSGCEPGGSSPAPDAAPPAPDAAPEPDAEAVVPACYEPSREAEIDSAPSTIAACAIRNNLANLSGRVLVARDRDRIRIEFPRNVDFAGTVEGALVTLENVHSHALTEQCLWRVTETLSGTLDPETCAMELGYRYHGQPADPSQNCDAPCAATASVSIDLVPL